ncbi:hypothetical protein [Pseudomonas sp.]|uniref:hypothetical protein n=1 Tax=Pseudomonas sp. TaxID=306 RepID=UPI003D0DC4EA
MQALDIWGFECGDSCRSGVFESIERDNCHVRNSCRKCEKTALGPVDLFVAIATVRPVGC